MQMPHNGNSALSGARILTFWERINPNPSTQTNPARDVHARLDPSLSLSRTDKHPPPAHRPIMPSSLGLGAGSGSRAAGRLGRGAAGGGRRRGTSISTSSSSDDEEGSGLGGLGLRGGSSSLFAASSSGSGRAGGVGRTSATSATGRRMGTGTLGRSFGASSGGSGLLGASEASGANASRASVSDFLGSASFLEREQQRILRQRRQQQQRTSLGAATLSSGGLSGDAGTGTGTGTGGGLAMGEQPPFLLVIGGRGGGSKGRPRGEIWSARPRPTSDGTLLVVRNASASVAGGGGGGAKETGGTQTMLGSPLLTPGGAGGTAAGGVGGGGGNVGFRVVAWEEQASAFATADERGQIYLFRVLKNNYVVVKGPGYQVTCLAFLPRSRGRELAAGCQDGRVLVIDTVTRQVTCTLRGSHEQALRSLCPHPRRPAFLTASEDALAVWATGPERWAKRRGLKSATGIVAAAYTPGPGDGSGSEERIVGVMKDGWVVVWDALSFALQARLPVPNTAPVAPPPSATSAASGASASSPPVSCPTALALSPHGDAMVVGDSTGAVFLYDLRAQSLLLIARLPPAVTSIQALWPTPTMAPSAEAEAEGQVAVAVLGDDGKVYGLRFLPPALPLRRSRSGSAAGPPETMATTTTMRCALDYELFAPLQRFEHGGLDPSGRYLVACLSDASVRLYDLQQRSHGASNSASASASTSAGSSGMGVGVGVGVGQGQGQGPRRSQVGALIDLIDLYMYVCVRWMEGWIGMTPIDSRCFSRTTLAITNKHTGPPDPPPELRALWREGGQQPGRRLGLVPLRHHAAHAQQPRPAPPPQPAGFGLWGRGGRRGGAHGRAAGRGGGGGGRDGGDGGQRRALPPSAPPALPRRARLGLGGRGRRGGGGGDGDDGRRGRDPAPLPSSARRGHRAPACPTAAAAAGARHCGGDLWGVAAAAAAAAAGAGPAEGPVGAGQLAGRGAGGGDEVPVVAVQGRGGGRGGGQAAAAAAGSAGDAWGLPRALPVRLVWVVRRLLLYVYIRLTPFVTVIAPPPYI